MDEDLEELKQTIFSILETSKNSIAEDELSMRMSNIEKSKRVKALNILIGENKVKATLNKNKLHYELVIEEKTPDDIVLEVIKDAGKNGIWIRDIRIQTRLSQIILNKALKSLETKKLIRSIKAISNRKLYILYDLQPDETVTGGACYESGFIKEDIVKNLKSSCFQYLYDQYKTSYDNVIVAMSGANIQDDRLEEDESIVNLERNIYATASDIFQNFKERKLFADIRLIDIEHILNVLCYECKLIKKQISSKWMYRFNPYNREQLDLFYAPCLVCHLYKDCRPGAVNIAPETCQYIHHEKF